MELISTIIVSVFFIDFQSNNVPVDDKPFEDIF